MSVIESIGRRRLRILVLLAIIGAPCGWLGVRWYRSERACERRGAALDARVQRIKSEARDRIEVGTKKEEIVRFLEENSLNVSFYNRATPATIVGTGTDVGCPHILGCGDEALIEVQIDVDAGSDAISRPTVDVRYTDCM
jgi:hypothetical protein